MISCYWCSIQNKLTERQKEVTPLQETIVQIVDANNGSCPYATVVDGVEYPQRQKVFASIRDLQNQGVLKREVAIDPQTGQSSLTISKVV